LYNEYKENLDVITFGNLSINGQLANIPLSNDFALLSKNIFDVIKDILFSGGQQHTVKVFGNIQGIDNILKDIERYNANTAIFYYSQGLIGTVKILCKGGNAISDVYAMLHKNIYAEEDISLQSRLLELLTVRNKILSIAESLTGGMICSDIIANSGASACFDEGVVTYSNDSKIQRLGIDGELIKKCGAVSYETAYEMAAGLLAGGRCGISIVTTGIAGPTGGTLTKPVGLTYIAVGSAEKVHVFRHIFGGDRNEIRKAASQAAMFYTIKVLKDKSLDYEVKIN
jgi:PncC family amidohydrolase